jgi:hypothetical protein
MVHLELIYRIYSAGMDSGTTFTKIVDYVVRSIQHIKNVVGAASHLPKRRHVALLVPRFNTSFGIESAASSQYPVSAVLIQVEVFSIDAIPR